MMGRRPKGARWRSLPSVFLALTMLPIGTVYGRCADQNDCGAAVRATLRLTTPPPGRSAARFPLACEGSRARERLIGCPHDACISSHDEVTGSWTRVITWIAGVLIGYQAALSACGGERKGEQVPMQVASLSLTDEPPSREPSTNTERCAVHGGSTNPATRANLYLPVVASDQLKLVPMKQDA